MAKLNVESVIRGSAPRCVVNPLANTLLGIIGIHLPTEHSISALRSAQHQDVPSCVTGPVWYRVAPAGYRISGRGPSLAAPECYTIQF